MLLAIDVGNTNIVFGVFKNDKLVHTFRVYTNKEKTADEYGIMIKDFLALNSINFSDIDDVIMSSVVPNITDTIKETVKNYLNLKVFIVNADSKTGINILIDNKYELGADNIVNSVAGRYLSDKAMIIIDFGTANTYHYVDENNNFIGGLISTGFNIKMDALVQKTAKLPRVGFEIPKKTLGRNTVESIQSGFILSAVGEIDFIIEKILDEVKKDAEEVDIIASGGLAQEVAEHSKYINIIEKNLTLIGLREIYKMNNV